MNSIRRIPEAINRPERMHWADVTRIIAIYLVIQVHTLPPIANWNLPFIVLSRLDELGVPLFVMLSGALLLGKQESYTLFFRKRCMKILLPWVVWTMIYMYYFSYFQHKDVVHEFFSLHNRPILLSWSHFFLRTFLSNLWFLPIIFILYLITPLLRIFVKHTKEFDSYYLIVLWFIFLSLFPYILNNSLFPRWEPNILLAPLQYSGYYILGYLLVKKRIFNRVKITVLLFLSLLPIGLSFLPFHQRYIKESMNGYLAPGTIIASLFFLYFIFAVFNKYDHAFNKGTKYSIAMISRASFGVYIIHGIVIDFLKVFMGNPLHVYHLEFFLTLIVFILSTFIIILLQRIPIIKYIVP